MHATTGTRHKHKFWNLWSEILRPPKLEVLKLKILNFVVFENIFNIQTLGISNSQNSNYKIENFRIFQSPKLKPSESRLSELLILKIWIPILKLPNFKVFENYVFKILDYKIYILQSEPVRLRH